MSLSVGGSGGGPGGGRDEASHNWKLEVQSRHLVRRRAADQQSCRLPGQGCSVLPAALRSLEGEQEELPCSQLQDRALDPQEKGQQKPAHLGPGAE